MIACMGGFCTSRDKCTNYHASNVNNPVERMCGTLEEPEPIRMEAHRNKHHEERGMADNQIPVGSVHPVAR